MSYEKYSLEVISHHSSFKNKSLRKYYVDGINTVGAWGDEPFEILFKNHTGSKVQVKLTLDGTDILTGQPATTEVTDEMWLVNGYGTLSLKAWPETHDGGAQLVFTTANNSVALHTHGDLSNRGIIAAAVYTEGYVAPVRTQSYRRRDNFLGGSYHFNYGHGTYGGTYGSSGAPSASFNDDDTFGASVQSNDSLSFEDCCRGIDTRGEAEGTLSKKTQSTLVSVGAGQHVDQHISYVPGLIKPVFADTVRMKYMWWDDLVAKLNEYQVAAPHPSGFPADNKLNIDLKGTPRVGSPSRTKVAKTAYNYLRV